MPRVIPACPDVPKAKSLASRSYTVELITPLFGGGVEPGVVDADMPIRATTVRGQLEFWWRATAGARCASVAELRQRQNEVWGSTGNASPVNVAVEILNRGTSFKCAEYERDPKGGYRSMPRWHPEFRPPLPYALFPFQGQRGKGGSSIEKEPATCVKGVSFRLIVELAPWARQDLWKDVEPALWAWANFGGVGSRTRRGCGAVFCKELAPAHEEAFKETYRKYVPERPAGKASWPMLAGGEVLLGKAGDNPVECWAQAVRVLCDLRQRPDIGRNPGSGKTPGRSRWPEPETIRKATKSRLPKHQRLQHIPDDAVPRAALGLPIIFHFKDRGDPPDTALYPVNDNSDRMASPLILRPMRFADGKCAPLIVRLNTPPLAGARLCDTSGKKEYASFDPAQIADPSLEKYDNSPMAGLSKEGCAVESLLAFATNERSFRRVIP